MGTGPAEHLGFPPDRPAPIPNLPNLLRANAPKRVKRLKTWWRWWLVAGGGDGGGVVVIVVAAVVNYI